MRKIHVIGLPVKIRHRNYELERKPNEFISQDSERVSTNIRTQYMPPRIIIANEFMGDFIKCVNSGFTKNRIKGPCIKYIKYETLLTWSKILTDL